MTNAYWENVKRDLFPEIEDWTDPQDHWRMQEDVRQLTYKQWFWFSPSAYKISHYGVGILGTIIFSLLGTMFYFKDIMFLTVLFAILASLMTFDFIKKYKNREATRYTNYYDIFLREF